MPKPTKYIFVIEVEPINDSAVETSSQNSSEDECEEQMITFSSKFNRVN
jgi:hypothetical protein